MINLDYLDIKIDDNYNLLVEGDIVKPKIRRKEDMKDVLLNYEGENEDLYYMYRGVFLKKDKEVFEKHRIRHDITLIKNKIIGREYNKTYGHYHPNNYPEIYEVLNGKALFILQSRDFRSLIIVEAKKGDQVVILPGYGHVTINIGNDPLILSNLVYWDFESDYSIYKEKKGAIIYVTLDGIVFNKNYLEDFFVVKLNGKKLFDENIYLEFLKNPENFKFLKESFKM
ncbi:MAG: glucose-6-phosphate isomerase family protein [Nanopusillaceae archaeon]